MSEAAIEADFVSRCRYKTYKLGGPGDVGKPDRLVLVGRGHCCFVEFKTPGEEATPRQKYEHEVLRSLGFSVLCTDSCRDALAFVESCATRYKARLVNYG
jgi:hypothetical protein